MVIVDEQQERQCCFLTEETIRYSQPGDQILDLLENAAGVALGGLVMTVTPVLTDFYLRPVIRSVTDSAAATTVTSMVAFRMVDGKELCRISL